MDLDDILPQKTDTSPTIGENLEQLSVPELEERMRLLENEMTRVKAEIDAKRAFKSAAEDVFKS